MKIRILLLFVMASIMTSCGPKVTTTNTDISQQTEMRISKINSDENLKETITEGALTDKEGFKDIGVFKYSVLFNENTNDLYRIKNEEITGKSITETYYFQNNALFYVVSESQNAPVKKMYVTRGKVIEKINVLPEEQIVLLEKAKRFQQAFKNKN